MPILHTVVKNYSRYPIDTVWENAQDLEHVSVLHPDTNETFTLLFAAPDPGSSHAYDTLIYTATRKLLFGFARLRTFGFRRIIRRYNLHQVEFIPRLGVYSALNSLVFPSDREGYQTMLFDEVVMDVPRPFLFMEKQITESLQRHTRIQCEQDEAFRARRVELAARGIDLPLSVFNRSAFQRLTEQFKYSVERGPGA